MAATLPCGFSYEMKAGDQSFLIWASKCLRGAVQSKPQAHHAILKFSDLQPQASYCHPGLALRGRLESIWCLSLLTQSRLGP